MGEVVFLSVEILVVLELAGVKFKTHWKTATGSPDTEEWNTWGLNSTWYLEEGSGSGFDLYAKRPGNLGLELAFNLSC